RCHLLEAAHGGLRARAAGTPAAEPAGSPLRGLPRRAGGGGGSHPAFLRAGLDAALQARSDGLAPRRRPAQCLRARPVAAAGGGHGGLPRTAPGTPGLFVNMVAAAPTLLSVNNYFYRRGGAESLFFAHNELLAQRGWQVVPFAMQHPRNEPTPWSRFFPAEIEYGRRYSPLRTLRNSQRIVYSLEARERLARLLEAVGAEVAHVHNIYHHLSPSVVALLRRRRIPVVMTV